MHSAARAASGPPTEFLMRRPALLFLALGLPLAFSLGGCTGFGTFLDHTFSVPGANPDLPQADAENVRRSLGRVAPVAPLVPESGNVWPEKAVLAATPTLSDLERNPAARDQFAPTTVPGEQPGLPAGHEPVPTGRPTEPRPSLPNVHPQRRRGSSTPPGSVEPGLAPLPASPLPPPESRGQRGSRPPGGAVQLPGGTGVDTGGTSGYRTLTLPNGQPGAIVVPNGNGTSTVIGPDGSVSTVPSHR